MTDSTFPHRRKLFRAWVALVLLGAIGAPASYYGATALAQSGPRLEPNSAASTERRIVALPGSDRPTREAREPRDLREAEMPPRSARSLLDDAEVRSFVHVLMPKTEELLRQEDLLPRQRALVYGWAVFQYRRFERRKEFPDLEIMFRQDIQDNDDLVGLAREASTAAPERLKAIREEARMKLRSMTKNVLVERARRVQKLREDLERQEASLKQDSERLDQKVERKLDSYIKILAEHDDATSRPAP